MQYNKSPLTFSQQANLLESRGLVIRDHATAEAFLSRVNYYHFSAYCLPFEKPRHNFISGTTFEQVQALYEFDRQLRLAFMEALEFIEIKFRTTVAYHLSHKYNDAFAHEEYANFYKDFAHGEWIVKVHEEASRSKETFIDHHRSNYDEFPALPVWVAVEIMSFGSISKMLSGMKKEDQIALAKLFNLHHKVLISWLHTMTYVRNLCAHHSRLWNRELGIRPTTPNNPEWNGVDTQKIVGVLFMVNFLLSHSCDNSCIAVWRGKIESLLSTGPVVPDGKRWMGLTDAWQTHPLWKK